MRHNTSQGEGGCFRKLQAGGVMALRFGGGAPCLGYPGKEGYIKNCLTARK
jgi:hypothetical protein